MSKAPRKVYWSLSQWLTMAFPCATRKPYVKERVRLSAHPHFQGHFHALSSLQSMVTWAPLPAELVAITVCKGCWEPLEQSPSRQKRQAKNTVPGGRMPIITAFLFCSYPPPLPGLKASPRTQTRWAQLSLSHRPRVPSLPQAFSKPWPQNV